MSRLAPENTGYIAAAKAKLPSGQGLPSGALAGAGSKDSAAVAKAAAARFSYKADQYMNQRRYEGGTSGM